MLPVVFSAASRGEVKKVKLNIRPKTKYILIIRSIRKVYHNRLEKINFVEIFHSLFYSVRYFQHDSKLYILFILFCKNFLIRNVDGGDHSSKCISDL